MAYAGVVVGTLHELGAYRDSRIGIDDFIAEVLYRLCKHGPHLRNPAASGAFVRRVTRNLYLDYLEHSPTPAALDVESQHAAQPSIDVQVMTAQLHAALLHGVSQLQRRYREVVEAVYFTGMSIHEAAKALRIEEHAVRNHLRAAKRVLRRRLKRFKPLIPSDEGGDR